MGTLPCTGPFKVGCVDLMTKSDIIPDDFDPYELCSANLGSLLRIYYPCVSDACTTKYKFSTWVPEPFQKTYCYGMMKVIGLSWFSWLGYYIKQILASIFFCNFGTYHLVIS